MNQYLIVALSIVGTGLFNAIITVAVVQVRLKYIERDIGKLEVATVKAHERIDRLAA